MIQLRCKWHNAGVSCDYVVFIAFGLNTLFIFSLLESKWIRILAVLNIEPFLKNYNSNQVIHVMEPRKLRWSIKLMVMIFFSDFEYVRM